MNVQNLRNKIENLVDGKLVSMTKVGGGIKEDFCLSGKIIYVAEPYIDDFEENFFNVKEVDPDIFRTYSKFEFTFDKKPNLEDKIDAMWDIGLCGWFERSDEYHTVTFEAFLVYSPQRDKIVYFGQNTDGLKKSVEQLKKEKLTDLCLSVNTNEDEPKKRRM